MKGWSERGSRPILPQRPVWKRQKPKEAKNADPWVSTNVSDTATDCRYFCCMCESMSAKGETPRYGMCYRLSSPSRPRWRTTKIPDCWPFVTWAVILSQLENASDVTIELAMVSNRALRVNPAAFRCSDGQCGDSSTRGKMLAQKDKPENHKL